MHAITEINDGQANVTVPQDELLRGTLYCAASRYDRTYFLLLDLGREEANNGDPTWSRLGYGFPLLKFEAGGYRWWRRLSNVFGSQYQEPFMSSKPIYPARYDMWKLFRYNRVLAVVILVSYMWRHFQTNFFSYKCKPPETPRPETKRSSSLFKTLHVTSTTYHYVCLQTSATCSVHHITRNTASAFPMYGSRSWKIVSATNALTDVQLALKFFAAPKQLDF